jgi:protein-S-isoprenylcysteine O-methyltransferase Ste14
MGRFATDMSSRTRDLPPLTGLSRAIREMRYHEFSRQGLGVVLILVYALTSRPGLASAAIGLTLAFLGMLVRLHASGFVMKNQALATEGPYALVRHPLFLGNILLVAGFSLAGATPWGLPLAAAFIAFYYPTAIEYEDRNLRRLFGDQWAKWAGRVPALVPNWRNARAVAGGSWSLTKSMRRNGEGIVAAYVLACMAIVIARLP